VTANIEAIPLTQKLVGFDTINPPGNELGCAVYLRDILKEAGFEVWLVPFAVDRANLVARIGNSDGPTLCFTGHMDTVPLGAQPWSVDPRRGLIADGKLFGRGSSDMKAGIAAFVTAALAQVNVLCGSRFAISLVLTVGEETGCEGALDLASSHRTALGRADALVIAEPTANRLLLGHKGVLWLRAETMGVTSHGSSPHLGVNAIHKAARLVERLAGFDFGRPRHAVMGNPTLNVGTIRGGLNINSVPDHAEIGIDIRTTPEISHADVVSDLTLALGDDLHQLVTVLDLPGLWTDPRNAWAQAVSQLVEHITGAKQEPAAAAYFTDGSALVPAFGTPPAIMLGPGDPAKAHQTDEYCEVTKIIEAERIYRDIIAHWLRQQS
jgi:succinyl-diaminopimelate desuccinylase